MKRKFIALLLGIVLSLSVLTGCNLITRNDVNYYNAIVATITYQDQTTDEITKSELITAYNSYGYNYVQNYGYTKEKAINTTIDSIIENYLTRKAVAVHYKDLGEEILNDRETSYLWNSTYDAIYSNLQSYVDGYKSSDENSSDDTSSDLFKDYTSTVYIDNDLVIRRKTPASTTRATYEVKKDDAGNVYDFEKKLFKEKMYDQIQADLNVGSENNQKAWKGAYTKYISAIKNNYGYLEYKTNKDWFMFELNRVYKILKDNYLVQKYEEIFNTSKHQDADVSSVWVRDVLDAYTDKVNADYTTYKLQNGSDYAEKMLSDIANMDYILEGDGTSNYFFVAPIKINLADGDSTLLEGYKRDLNNNVITKARYDELVAQIFDANRELVNVRNADTGEIENHISVNSLKNRIDEAVSAYNYDAGEDADYNYNVALQKAEAYRKYFYLYNEETTYKNADYNAVFGVNATGTQALVNSNYDKDGIKEAILSLYNAGNAQIGDVSDIVETEDGFYIFFYAGKIENLFEVVGDRLSLPNQAIRTLASKRLNIFSQKTLFDSIYSTLESDNFSVFKNMDMNELKNKTKSIEIFVNNVKDLYKD